MKENINLETVHYYENEMFKIRLNFNGREPYKWVTIQYKNFFNEQQTNIRYDTLNDLNQKIRTKLNTALREL
ncbi:unnamed protein product [Rotaria sordida]|uniref:Uncharacterized protein n=1 Tax=Rotaria sordida TaxID=392033 RepID=A0A814MJV9_9BILA|nr:unnamed protein product [Rotaria sordida]